MKVFSATATINASAERVWAILTDGPNYTKWDPNMVRIEGDIAHGNKITVYTKISPDRAFPVKVLTWEPNRKMVWGSKMPLGMFKGERTFTITPKGEGVVELETKEEFSGWMKPIINSIPDLSETFTQFVEGCKAYAETE